MVDDKTGIKKRERERERERDENLLSRDFTPPVRRVPFVVVIAFDLVSFLLRLRVVLNGLGAAPGRKISFRMGYMERTRGGGRAHCEPSLEFFFFFKERERERQRQKNDERGSHEARD